MVLFLCEKLVRKIFNILDIRDLLNTISVNKSLYKLNYHKNLIPIKMSLFFCHQQELTNMKQEVLQLKNEFDYTLKEYLFDLKYIMNSIIYYHNRKLENNKKVNLLTSVFPMSIYKNNPLSNSIQKRKFKKSKIHHTYRIPYCQYIFLKQNHLNILALIY